MADLRVIEAISRPLRDAFIDLPYRLYRGDPAWVAPLRSAVRRLLDPRPRRNPFLSHGLFAPLIALRGDRPVGRVVAIDDRGYNQRHGTHHGFFGLLEVEDDPEAMAALLHQAEAWCRERGADVLLGPLNFSTNGDCGLLIEGFAEPPMIGLAHGRPTYPELLEGCGLRKAWDYLAYRLPMSEEPEVPARGRRLVLRPPDPGRYEEEMARVLGIYNQAFGECPAFSPLTEEEVARLVFALRPVLRPELLLLAELSGELIGFSLALPNLNEALQVLRGRLLPLRLLSFWRRVRRIRSLRVCCMGVLPEHRHSGLIGLFCSETLAAARRLGYRAAELSLVHEEDEAMRESLAVLGAVVYKRWRIYRKEM
jgi:GNAT superfamily N-acetyltransferase